jgi:hypothetical protein
VPVWFSEGELPASARKINLKACTANVCPFGNVMHKALLTFDKYLEDEIALLVNSLGCEVKCFFSGS